jgi:hypothetical protein
MVSWLDVGLSIMIPTIAGQVIMYWKQLQKNEVEPTEKYPESEKREI